MVSKLALTGQFLFTVRFVVSKVCDFILERHTMTGNYDLHETVALVINKVKVKR